MNRDTVGNIGLFVVIGTAVGSEMAAVIMLAKAIDRTENPWEAAILCALITSPQRWR